MFFKPLRFLCPLEAITIQAIFYKLYFPQFSSTNMASVAAAVQGLKISRLSEILSLESFTKSI